MRPLWNVLEELREEQHVPMAALLDALRQHEWATALRYDLSMLRLWISRQGTEVVEVMIVVGDGRGGGCPVEPYLDAFETTFFVGANAGNVKTGTKECTIEMLRQWLELGG
ncbi:MAG: hypothetical protein R3B06_00210 [Kofleriaceae bacterium]